MQKELENLLEDLDSGEEIKTKYGICYAYSPDVVDELKQALTELKQIKKAKPSEALGNISRGLETIENDLIALAKLGANETFDDLLLDISKVTQLIKKDLQTLQSKSLAERCWEIIKKYFDIKVVTSNESAFGCITIQRKNCNQMLHQAQKTTFKKEEQEEFNTLKEWLKRWLE